jgi:cytochrome c biogenesis protein CcmG/thiol:disulfide interchange protein DsbE
MKRLIIWLPLGVFAIFLWFAAFGLGGNKDEKVHSKMVGKPMPDFTLKPAVPNHPALTTASLRQGKPRLVNVFASWCVPCRAEAPHLMALKQRGIPIDGIAIRDKSEDVASFLAEYGDPFDRIGADPRSQIQFALGSSGVPETFIVDGKGVIRHQHIGDIRPENVSEIVAAYEEAK